MARMKPRIAFLYSGEIRSNSLNDTVSNNSLILDTTSTYLLNDELRTKYNYDIFISTNTIDISAAYVYFGESLKNIHLYEKKFYQKPVEKEIPEYEIFRQRYATYNYDGKWVSKGNLWQMYRILDVANLMENYIASTNTSYDLIVRCRLDTPFKSSVIPLLDELIANSSLQATAISDLYIIGKPSIMNHYLHVFENNYMLYKKGKYTFDRFIMDHPTYSTCDEFGYRFSPEVQISETFFQYCIENNIDIASALKGYDQEPYLYIYDRHRFA